MKRLLSLATLLLLAVASFAHDFEVDGIYYKIDPFSTSPAVSVCYKGTSYDSYANEYAGNIIIPETVTYGGKTYSVTEIAYLAFSYCKSLTSVTIPNSVTSIEWDAFSDCSGLKSVTIPSSVTTIDRYAFENCSGLTSITIPNSVMSIGSYAFSGCSNLTSVTIGNRLANIGNYAFNGCSNLTSVTFHSRGISSWFKGISSIKEIVIGDEVNTIVRDAFDGTAWYDNQPDGVVYAGKMVYRYKGTMPVNTSVILKEGTRGISDYAFSGCSGLVSITIPESVTTIGNNAFEGTFWYDNQPDGVVYAGKLAYKYKGTMPTNTSVTLKEGTVGIGDIAFADCSGLTSIIIPSSVKKIGSSAFYGCSGLASITIPEGVTSIGDGAFDNCSALTVVSLNSNSIVSKTYRWSESLKKIFGTQVKTYKLGDNITCIGDWAFEGCSALTSITMDNSVTSIGNYAFSDCSALTSITMGNSVTSIGNWAFVNCSRLNSIIIPKNVVSIGDFAFDSCSGLTSITIPKSVTTIGNSVFSRCPRLTSIVVTPGNTKYDSRDNSNAIIETSSNTLIAGCKNTIIPNNVTKIGDGAFQYCSGLTSITIPNSVVSIGDKAFNCSDVISITIGNSVTTIGNSAFFGCSALTSVTIPESVTNIGNSAFASCNVLTDVLLNSNTIASETYSSTSSLRDIFGTQVKTYQLGNNINSIGSYAFYGYSGLASITIGNRVSNISNSAFYDCTNPDMKFYVDKNTIALFGLWGKMLNTQKGKETYSSDCTYDVNTGEKIELFKTTASSISVFVPEPKNYTITSKSVTIEGKSSELMNIKGLVPNKDIRMSLTIIYKYDERNDKIFSANETVKTKQLTLITEQPKVVTAGNVIVSATTNIDPEETNIGFEWRRVDWSDTFVSQTASAILLDGTMEGYIRNMNAEKLWNYRAYYLSDAGVYYYGDWVGIDPSNTSYFEPTVHTYADISTTGNVALIRGYVLNGTDKIKVQGFKYWKTANKGNSLDIDMEGDMQTTAIPADAITKTVDIVGAGQQLMNATLNNLDYGSTYECVAFATTSENETFYGEVQSFTTEADPTGIEGVKEDAGSSKAVTVVACYDLNGKRFSAPQKGLNILRMSDGTTRKVVR